VDQAPRLFDSSPPGPVDVAFVLPDFHGGGAQRVAVNLANGLHRRGLSILVLVFDAKGPLFIDLAQGIRVMNLQSSRLRNAAPRLLATIRRNTPRIVFSTFGYINVLLGTLSFLFPKQSQLWLREANLPSLSLPHNCYPKAMRLGYRFAYPRAQRVISTSERMRAEFRNSFAIPDEVLHVLRNPIDEAAIRSRSHPSRRHSGAGTRFIAAGRLTEQKGFDQLLQMFASIVTPESHLTILGEGPQLGALQDSAALLGITDRVSFRGYEPNPWPWYAGADAFLLPSRWEGMPNAALEALACGAPVIATPQAGAIAEVGQLTKPGAITLANTGHEFAEAMKRVRATSVGLRPSLLPEAFRLDDVIDLFIEWIENTMIAPMPIR